jgi:glc operon protein GlcG
VAQNLGRKITPVHSLLAFAHLAYLSGRCMTGVEVGTTPFRRYDDAAPLDWRKGYEHLGYGEMMMRKTNWVALLMSLIIGAFLAGSAAKAQPPTPTPPPDYGAPINNEQAKEAAAAAITEARKNGWRMAIAVVDPGGYLVYFEKIDGTQNASVALAQAKARTSALYRRPSKVFSDQFSAGNTGFMSFPNDARPIASEGGIPIVVNGRLIGAIGASGGTGQQDSIAAMAGASAVR